MSDVVRKERYSGTFNGQRVSFNRIFRKRRLSDDDCEALLRGESIRVYDLVNKEGKRYAVKATLQHKTGIDAQSGNTYTFFAPDMTEFIPNIPRRFCQHDFTDEEYAQLVAGKSVHCDDFVNKKGETFSSSLHWGYNAERESDGFIFER